MNEKGAGALNAGFQISPPQLNERVEHAFAQLNGSAQAISAGIETFHSLLEDCGELIEKTV